MTSPNSSLKKTKKTPLPSMRGADRHKLAVPYRQSPASASPTTDQTDFSLIKSSEALEREIRRSFGGVPQTCTPDGDFIASMARRLRELEQQLLARTKELIEKDQKIKVLEDKIAVLETSRSSGGHSTGHQMRELEQKCLMLQSRQQEMERFLADYGMIWVGEESDDDDEKEEEDISTTESSVNGIWRPDSSACQPVFAVDFNKIMKNIQELNALAGEDEAKVSHTVNGARLKFPDPIPMVVYKNGFIIFSGPFRPYSDPLSQRFMQDIMDGYFPSELQQRYPDGVPILLTDKREVLFRDRRQEESFPGSGKVLGGDSRPSHVLSSHSSTSENRKGRKQAETSEPPGGIIPVDRFLNRLPKSVVKNGKVIDIRSEISQKLQRRPGSGVVTVVDTPTIQAIREGHSSDKDVTTLRVKSEAGDQTYIVKLKFSNTIQDLHHYIDSQRSGNSRQYCIRTAFPNKVYDNMQATLEQCGLTPNATLHLSPV